MSENSVNIISGLNIPSQIPLNPKLNTTSEATLVDLGLNDNLAYTYEKGLVIYCQLEGTRYEWREVLVGEELTGLRSVDFVYPTGIIANNVDYSNKKYNFFKTEIISTPISIEAGDNIIITGIGSLTNPYIFTGLSSPFNTLNDSYFPRNRDTIQYGTIGQYAYDFSLAAIGSYGDIYGQVGQIGIHPTEQYGALGESTYTFGYNLSAGGYGDSLFGQYNHSDTQSQFSTVFGRNNYNNSYHSIIGGSYNRVPYTYLGHKTVFGQGNVIDGTGGLTSGIALLNKSFSTTVLGQANNDYTNTSQTVNDPTAPILIVGNGNVTTPVGIWTSTTRSDALKLLKNGLLTLPSVSNSLITADITGKAVVTKEYLESISNSIPDGSETKLQAGVNISILGNGTTLTPYVISSTNDVITQYTDELAQDAVGGILQNSDSIEFIYDDIAATITANVIASSILDNTYLKTEAGYIITNGTLTINSNWEWVINNELYTNITNVNTVIPLAAIDYSRIDTIVLTASNTIERLSGVESLGIAVSEIVPPNKVQALSLLVTDTSITILEFPQPKNVVTQFIRNGIITTSPSEDVVYDKFEEVNTTINNIFSQIDKTTFIITDKGYIKTGLHINLLADWEWQIKGILYTNISNFEYDTVLCSTGKSRFDVLTLTATEGVKLITGEESIFNPTTPSNLYNEIIAITVLVTDSTVEVIPTLGNPVSQTITAGIIETAPSENVVYNALLLKENNANKISTITGYSETLYPNEKATHDGLDLKLNISDLPTNLTLYPTTAVSDVAGYVKMVTDIHDVDYNTVAVDVSTPLITTINQLISSRISAAGVLIGQPGVFNITTFGNIRHLSGSGTASFYFEVYQRTAAGVETLICTSSNSLPVTNGGYSEFSASGVWDDGDFLATDRIVIKSYANRIVGGSDPIYQFQFGGSTPVRTILPVPFSVVDAGYEVKINKVSTLTASDILYPNNNAVIAGLALKENLANKQNSLTVDGTGVKFPTVDAVNKNITYVTAEQFGAVADGITDDKTAIQNAINSGKMVMLNGNYFTSGTITISNKTTIYGNGKIIINANLPIFDIKANDIFIDGIRFEGNGRGTATNYSTTRPLQIGINLEGVVDATVYKNIRISNVSFYNLGGAGIKTANNKDTLYTGGLLVSNTQADLCYIGYFSAERGEYNSFSNIRAVNCEYGAYVNAGNNAFSNIQFQSNRIGMYYSTGVNPGKSTVNGGSITHSLDRGLDLNGLTFGQNFYGVQIQVNDIYLSNSDAVRFINCDIRANIISVTTSTNTNFKNCKFIITPTSFTGMSLCNFSSTEWLLTPTVGFYDTNEQQLNAEKGLKSGIVGSSIPVNNGVVSERNVYAADANKALYLFNNGTTLKLDAFDYSTFSPLDFDIGGNGGVVSLKGNPTAPTAAPGTNTTQIATTAFVLSNLSGSLEFNDTNKTVWNNGKGNIATNTSFGSNNLSSITTGESNTSLGDGSLLNTTNGTQNTSVGKSSLAGNISGSNNTSIGYISLPTSTESGNTSVGAGAFYSLTSGSSNTSLGFEAGAYYDLGLPMSTSNNSVFIGNSSRGLSNNSNNEIVIGSTSVGSGSNTATLGNTSITKTVLRGVIQQTTYTVSWLPAGILGMFAVVTDATSPTYLGALTGGGSTVCPVFYDGSSWKATGSIDSRVYKVYTALISQSGTTAPTVTVLENTTGSTITFSYNSVGSYTMTSSLPIFTTNKMWKSIEPVQNLDAVKVVFSLTDSTNMNIGVVSSDGAATRFNGYLTSNSIEIRVYN